MRPHKSRLAALASAAVAISGVSGAVAVAAQTSGGATPQTSGCLDGYPGNGYGDAKKNHTGPPPASGIFCGNGYGDSNKTHNGPPGQGGK